MGKLRTRTFTGALTSDISEREKAHRPIARRAAGEGFVLLKNDNEVLPLAKNCSVGLYGVGAVKTVKGGTGSGDVNERHSVTIFEGLKEAGFTITNEDYCKAQEAVYNKARKDWAELLKKEAVNNPMGVMGAYMKNAFMIPAGDPVDEAKAKADGADTAIYVLSRVAGEGADRFTKKGDYYAYDEEVAILKQLSACYKNLVLIINTGGLVDLGFVDEIPNITSIIQFMQAGQEGGHALADVLTGDVVPSGKMTDTWALNYSDYPMADTFSHQNGDIWHEEYYDGIFVGYRYFDTFEVPVRYCFGHGLSYTKFDIKTGNVTINGKGTKNPTVSIEASVTNTGSKYCGKEVVQVYVACPQGSLTKEYRRLAGFAKTKLLAPGETQNMTITFPVYGLASYCEECSSYILEKGSYNIFVGNSLSASVPAASIELSDDAVMVKCESICKIQKDLKEIEPDKAKLAKRTETDSAKFATLPKEELKKEDIVTEEIKYEGITDKLPGKAGEIVESLTLDELVALATGDPAMGQGSVVGDAGQTVPGAAAETTSKAVNKGVASIVLCDGPAGIRISQEYDVVDGKAVKLPLEATFEHGIFTEKAIEKDPNATTYYQFCTAIPVGTLLAQTWNPELIKEVGAMIGDEMNEYETALWLAPGMNIHRNPLCGRNFEYYSEDPLVSGIIAAAMTKGVQSKPGVGTTIKHFATNNQEDNRMGSDSIIHERALREIYLKGFEIAIKDSQPMSIMTSYNMINGIHTANCYDICTMAARDEWGFAGAIMTDWGTTNWSPAGVSTASGCLKAGNDMTMPGMPTDHENIKVALEDGSLTMTELKKAVYNTVKLILQTNQYEDAKSYSEQFSGLGNYLSVK